MESGENGWEIIERENIGNWLGKCCCEEEPRSESGDRRRMKGRLFGMWHFVDDREDLSAHGNGSGGRKRLILKEKKGAPAEAKSFQDKSEWNLQYKHKVRLCEKEFIKLSFKKIVSILSRYM